MILTNFKKRVILYRQWYKQLRQQYGIWQSFTCAIHNSGTHELDGQYRKW